MKMDLTGKKIVAIDAECLRDVAPPFTFGASQFLGNAVTCSVTHNEEYKDWVGDSSIFAFYKYLLQFDMIVSFNGLGFDYPLWGGSMLGPEHMEARKIFEKTFKGRTVDLCVDFHETLGVRTGLNKVAIPTLGDAKEMDGGFAPQHWRNGRCMEVIEYCRGDVRRTMQLFLKAAAGEELKVTTKDGQIRTFKCEPKLR
jgi:hypothetical protein